MKSFSPLATDVMPPASTDNQAAKKIFKAFCRILFSVYCPITSKGANLLPSSPFILCSNHCSHMDSAALMMATGLPFSQFGMIAAKDYFFDQPKRRRLLDLLNLIPLERKCTRQSLAHDLALCKAFSQQGGRNLIIYPEGTRSASGQMGVFKRGTAIVAANLDLPVVPVYIEGTYRALPKGCFFPKPTRLTVVFGAAIYPDQYKIKLAALADKANFYRSFIQEVEMQIRQLKTQHDNK